MILLLIIFVMVLFFILIYTIFNVNSHGKTAETAVKKGKISGMVLRKFDGSGAEGVEVLLGKLDIVEGKHVFKSEKGSKTVTDSLGKYSFENIEYGSYWVYVHVNGRKIVRMVKVSVENPVNEEVLLTV